MEDPEVAWAQFSTEHAYVEEEIYAELQETAQLVGSVGNSLRCATHQSIPCRDTGGRFSGLFSSRCNALMGML